MRLYHFVNEKYGVLNLQKRRLKLARIADLNDPFELAPACPDAKARRVLDDFKRQAHEAIGLLCFSKRRDNPVQWSHYADGHKGICLGFDVPDDHVTKVEYTPIRPVVDMRTLFASQSAGEQEINRWLNVKYDHWRYEQEWRSAFSLDMDTRDPDGNYYEEFGSDLRLAEVMVGVRSTLTRLDVTSLLGDLAESVGVSKARLSFKDSYRVVNQQDRKRW